MLQHVKPCFKPCLNMIQHVKACQRVPGDGLKAVNALAQFWVLNVKHNYDYHFINVVINIIIIIINIVIIIIILIIVIIIIIIVIMIFDGYYT